MSVEQEWEWWGIPGHFMSAAECNFRMCTTVGPFLVSTVGEWFPSSDSVEGPLRVNTQGFYETMVFRWVACTRPDCNCGMPEAVTEWGSIETNSYTTRREAHEGHYAMCRKWASTSVIDALRHLSEQEVGESA